MCVAGPPRSSAAKVSIDQVDTQPVDVTSLPTPAETPPEGFMSPLATADDKRSKYQVKPEPRARTTEDKSSEDAKPEKTVERKNKPVTTKKITKTDDVTQKDQFTESDQEAGMTKGLMYCMLFCYRVNIYIIYIHPHDI